MRAIAFQSLAIVGEDGKDLDVVVQDGELVGDADRTSAW